MSTIQEPVTYSQASEHIGWFDAIKRELEAFKVNNTWEFTCRKESYKI